MAAKFDVSAITLNPTEVSEVAKIIVEKVFETGLLSDEHEIFTGIQTKTQILFLEQLGIGGEKLVGCTPAELESLKFTEKFWNPFPHFGRMTHCATDENRLFKILKNAKTVYPDLFEGFEGDQVKELIAALLITHIEESIRAKAWFSDENAATYANGGNFTNGTNLNIFNQNNGLWKQIIADALIPRTTIAENTGATKALQILTAGNSVVYLKSVWDKADSRLKGNTEAQFYVTPEIYDDFLWQVAQNEINGGINQTLKNGDTGLTFMGKKIIKKDDWFRNITQYKDNGTVYELPNRIVFTVKENIPIGTLNETDLTNLRVIFDPVSNTNIIDYGYFLDAVFGESYLASVAY